MDISDAASYFDNCNVLDSSDVFLFKAQLDIYDNSTSEGTSASRRTLNAAPGSISLPVNKILKIDSKEYIAGTSHQDSFQGYPIRDSLILQVTNILVKISSITSLLSGGASTETPAFISWRKTQKEEEKTSEYFNLYDIHIPSSIDVATAQYIATTEGEYFITTVEKSSVGLNRVVCYELEVGAYGGVSYFTYLGYDPVSGVSLSTSSSLPVVFMRYAAGYDLERFSAKKFELGDSLFFTSSTGVKIKDEIERGGRRYSIISVTDDAFQQTGLRVVHCRRTDA